MKLLVSGCSHSAGSEIIQPWHSHCHEQAYGQYVYEYFKFDEYKNIAGPGFSNHWIANETIKFLLDQDNPQEWFVIIGWTNPGRIPVYDYENNKEVHLCPNHTNLKVYGKAIQTAYNHLYETLLPIDTLIEMEHNRIFSIQMMLTQMKIPYLFFDAVGSNHKIGQDKGIQKDRYYRYNDEATSYWYYYQKHVWDKSDRWANHAPAQYHKEWAQNLSKFIELNRLTVC